MSCVFSIGRKINGSPCCNSTLEAEEYVYTFLRNFPENTFALPQVFRKVVKGLNSSHWLAKKVDELKNRRWRKVPGAEFGRLGLEEVRKLMVGNPAFWECYMQKKPPDEVLLKKQAQYDKKTANVKQSRVSRPAEEEAGVKQESASPKSAKASKKTRLINRANAAAAKFSIGAESFTELADPTAIEMLEEIVQGNPVLSKIRECGVKAKREDVYPTSTTLQAGKCFSFYVTITKMYNSRLNILSLLSRGICLHLPETFSREYIRIATCVPKGRTRAQCKPLAGQKGY